MGACFIVYFIPDSFPSVFIYPDVQNCFPIIALLHIKVPLHVNVPLHMKVPLHVNAPLRVNVPLHVNAPLHVRVSLHVKVSLHFYPTHKRKESVMNRWQI